MAKNIPLDVEEETALRAKYAGLIPDEITTAASAIRTQKAKSSEISGTLSGKLDVFEKKGGHKSALKHAERVADMESAECADYMRAFLAYFDALGGNDQLDMFVQSKEKEANAASVTIASKSAEPPKRKAKTATETIVGAHAPKQGAEPTATVQ
jgi:hypothetical protein